MIVVSLPTIVSSRDTISVIDASKVAEFYSSMMDKQATQFTILISVLCGIVVFIIGATWWWNYRGAKQQIAEESENNRKVFQRLFKTSTAKMEDELNNSLKEEVSSLSQTIHDELEEYKKSTTDTIDFQKAELSRVFALHCDSINSLFTAATWWYSAASLYNKTGTEKLVQVSVNAGLSDLKQTLKNKAVTEDDKDKLDGIMADVDTLPEILSAQKEETHKLVKSLHSVIKEPGKSS